MKSNFSIRYRQDANGWWVEIRNTKREIVKLQWAIGSKRAAQDDARRMVQQLERSARAA